MTFTLPCGTTSPVATDTWFMVANWAQISSPASSTTIGQATMRQLGSGCAVNSASSALTGAPSGWRVRSCVAAYTRQPEHLS